MSGVNYREFSAKIKSKYPQYANVDDFELAKKIVEKYPEYSDQVLFDEVPTDEESVRRAKEDVYGVSYKPEDTAPDDNRIPSADNLPETLSYKEGEKEAVPNYFGLFDKKGVVDTANKLGVSVGFFDKVGEAASQAEYAPEKLYEAFEIKQKAEALKKHFPEVTAEADSILSDLVGTSPNKLEDISARVSALEGAVASYVEEQPTWPYRGYINDTYDDPLSMATKRMIENTKNLKKAATEDATTAGRIVRGTGKGIQQYVEGFTKIVQEMASNRAVVEINNKLGKVANGEDVKFTDQERMFLQVMVDNVKIQDEYGKRVGISYNIGEAFGQSLGFMAEFVMTGGMASGATKLGQGAKVVSKAVQIGRATKVGKVATNMAIKAAQAGVQTLGMPSFYQKVAVGVSNGNTFGDALLDSYWQMWAENMSERIFMSKIVPGKEGANVLDRMLGRMGTTMTTEKGTLGVLKSTLEESAEEKIGEILTAPKDFDNFSEFWKSFTDVEQNKIMLGSVSLMTGLMGSPAVALNAYDKVSTGIKVDQLRSVLDADITGGIDKIYSEKDLNAKDAMSLVFDLIDGKIKQLPRDTNYPQVVSDALRYAQLKAKQTAMAGLTEKEFNELLKEKQGKIEPVVEPVEETPELTEQQKQIDYLKSRGQVIPDGTDMETLNKMFSAEKTKERTEVNTEIDTKVKAAQEKLGLPQTPDIEISDDTEATLDRLDEGLPVTNEFIKAASQELYDRYKELEAMKTSDTRLYTTEQIESMQGYLGEEIERLENYASEQKETGEFVSEVKVGEVAKGKAEGVAEGVSGVVGEPQKPVETVSKESGQIVPAEEKAAVKPSEEAVAGNIKNGRVRTVLPVEKPDTYLEYNGKRIHELDEIEDLLANGDDSWAYSEGKSGLKRAINDEMPYWRESPNAELLLKQANWLLDKIDNGEVTQVKSSFVELIGDKEKTIKNDFIKGKLGRIVKSIDESLSGKLKRAIDSWLGVTTDMKKSGIITGVMNESPLENLYASEPTIIEEAMAETKSHLREKYGDTITLYRSEDVDFGKRSKRTLLSYTSDPLVADFFYKAGKTNLIKEEIPIDDIVWVTDRMNQSEFIVKSEGVEDAVQVKEAGRVPVQPAPGVGEKVEGRAPEAKPKEVTGEKKEVSWKQQQFDVIQRSNPMTDEVHTGIRKVEDIKTADEVFAEPIKNNENPTPDFTVADMKAALESGEVTIYSSNEIADGVFVTPSKMQAKSYSGDGKVYSKKVALADVAWIDMFEGQYAKVKEVKKESDDKKRKRRLQRTDRQPAANGQPIVGKGETSAQGVRLVDGTFVKAGDEVVYKGETRKVKSVKGDVVTIPGVGDVHKSKVLAPTKPVQDTRGFNLEETNPNKVNDDLLSDEVFDKMRMNNIEPSDTDVLGTAALAKSLMNGDVTVEAAINEAVDRFAKRGTVPDHVPFFKAAPGAKHTSPYATYNDAVRGQDNAGKNLWVRNTPFSTNKDRVLLVQFSSNFLYGKQPFKRSKESSYFDKLYRLVAGYNRTVDFWEVPLWMARIAGLQRNADVYVIRDIEEAKKFINEAGYDSVHFSALDVNEKHIVDVIQSTPGVKYQIGGYTDFKRIEALPDVTVYKSIDEYVKNNKLSDIDGTYSYRHFKGTAVIPRLKLSEGCLYKCAFCSIPKKVIPIKKEWIDSQIESIKDLDATLVYLDDKTFGQAENYILLPELYERIKEYNPDFKGFIIQTTALDFANKKRFSPEYLKNSHIQFVELGVETYNDDILTKLNKKHSHKKFVDAAMQNARDNNIKVIPNIIVGLSWNEGTKEKPVIKTETRETYQNTLDFLENNKDVISHVNVYSLALYEGTELSDAIEVKEEADKNENIIAKSWQENKEDHEWAMDEFSDFASNQIQEEKKDEVQKEEKGLRNEKVNKRFRKISRQTGTDAATVERMYNTLMDVFGLSQDKALAGAVIVDRMVGTMAKRTNKTKDQVYATIKWEKGGAIAEMAGVKQDVLGKARGATMFMDDANAVIMALTDPNVTTPLHELTHVYEKYLTAKEKEQILKWTGEKSWSVNTSESFARGSERFLYDGTAPGNLKAIFQKFAAWLKDIYKTLVASEINIALNEDMRRIYSTMLGSEYVEEKVPSQAPETAEEAADAFFGSAPVDADGNIILSDEEIADEFFSGLEVDENGVIKFQFIGATGAARLDAAENNNNRIFNLREAMKMTDANKTAEEIKLATGWEKGKDKRWRYEIPDNMKMRPAWDKLKVSDFNDKYELPITEAMDYPELFAAYPELEKIKIRKDTAFLDIFQSVQGWYDHDSMELVVAPHAVDPFGTVLHELQHAVQMVEGFATGSNTEDIIDAIPDFEFESVVDQLVEQLERDIKKNTEKNLTRRKILSGLTAKEEADIRRYSKEIIAAGEEGDRLYKEEKKKFPDKNPFLDNKKLAELRQVKHELRDKINDIIERVLGERSITLAVEFSYGIEAVEEYIDETSKKIIEDNKAKRSIEGGADKAYIIKNFSPVLGDMAYNYYKRVAGETEARNVATRAKLTPEQRRSTAESTEDIPRDQQIVMRGGKIVSMDLGKMTVTVDGKKRPVLNSEGRPIHNTEEGVINFWKWFGESRVTDEHGRPLVVYHGTRRSFDEFNPSISDLLPHFGTIEQANEVVGGVDEFGENIVSVYLSIKNPLRLIDLGGFDSESVAYQLYDKGIISKDALTALLNHKDITPFHDLNKWMDHPSFLRWAIEKAGYDGVIYLNRREGLGELSIPYKEGYEKSSDKNFLRYHPEAMDSYMPLFNTNIKSATGNVGTFSPETGNILFQEPKTERRKGVELLANIGKKGIIRPAAEKLIRDWLATKQYKVDESLIKDALDSLTFTTVSPIGFYSTVENALTKISQSKGTPEQFKAMLLNNGAKQAELDWMGWNEFVSGKKAITKTEVQDWINANNIQVEEVSKGGVEPNRAKYETLYEEVSSLGYKIEIESDHPNYDISVYDKSFRNVLEDGEARAEVPSSNLAKIDALVIAFRESVPMSTDYSQYILPGGESYRELLLTMRPKPLPYTVESRMMPTGKRWYVIDPDGKIASEPFYYRSEAENVAQKRSEIADVTTHRPFRSAHWSEEDVLVHVRFDERTDADGKRVLFVEEIQSDWAQEGKKKGFRSDQKFNAELRDLYAELDRVDRELNETIKQARDAGMPTGASSSQWREFEKGEYTTPDTYRLIDLQNTVRNNRDFNAIQAELDAIRDNQIRIGKDRDRLIREREKINAEIESAKDYWSVKRYKAVPDMPFKNTEQWVNLALRRVIRYAAENGFDRVAWTTGEQQADRYDLSKQLSAIHIEERSGKYLVDVWDKSRNKYIDRRLVKDQNELSELIGKDMTNKFLTEREKGYKSDNFISEDPDGNAKMSFEGLDLKVGGEGMKAFYDKIIPSAVSKLGKPFGAKVESTNIRNIDINTFQETPYYEVQSISITQTMRESAMEGMPLFQAPKSKRDIAVDMLYGLIKNETSKEAARARIDAYLTSRGIKFGVDGGNIVAEAISRLRLSDEVMEAPVRPTRKGEPSGRVVAERPLSGKVKESKLGIRVIDGESAMPQHIKNEIMAGNLHKYDVFPDEIADATAGELYRANGLDGSIAIFSSRENRLHAKLEVFLGAYIVEGINREISRAEKDGRIGDANYWATRMVNFTKDYIATVSVERAQGLAALNSARVQSLFPSRAFLMKYEMAVSETRKDAMETRTFKRKVKQIKNDGNKAHKEVLSDVLDDLNKKLGSIKEGASLRDMMKQKKALLDELKARRKNPPKMQMTIPSIPGLDPVDVAYGASIASVYIQAGIYGEKLVKGLVKDFKSIGVDITEEQAEKMVPSVINVGGTEVSVDDFLDELEGEKEAMRLANRIFGAITPKKETKDPLTMMLNTLMAKFNERNLNKPERKKVSDIEKIGEAIRDKEHYAETWKEARRIALDMIEANEEMDIDQKEIMSKMIDDAYDKATSFVFSEGQVDRAIRAKMKDMGMVLADIVRSHFDVQVRNRGSLTEAIIIDAGIDRADAEMLARAIERRYDSLMSEHGRRLIKKYTQHLTPTQKRSVGRRSNEERLLELINIGAFDDPSFVDAFASARGLVTIDPVHVRNIKAKAEEINKQKSRVLRLKKTEDLLGYMATLEGVSLAEIGDAVWYASVLSGMSTQVRNIMGGGAGVGINLATEMLWHPSYVPAMLRGIWRGVKFGKEKAEDVLKYGYSPYETRVETPRVVERYIMNPKALWIPPLAHVFNNLKYVSRFMAAADMFNVSVGKEAWAELLALEHLKLNDKKVSGLDYIFDSKYRKQVRSAINTFLGVTKEQIDAITAEVEADALELGYTETDKKIAIIEGIEMIRPGALVEVSTTMAVKSTGNTRTYGMIGFITDRLADVMKGVALPFPEKTKTGEIALGVIHPFKYVAAFTKIVSNVGALALEYVPFAAMPRYVSGAAGAAFKPGGSLSKIMPMYGKYYHELSETERKAVLHRQIVGMVFTAAMVMLSDPGDDDDPIIQITADGTGDWNKNNSLKDWKPYSLGIKVGDKRVWVPFRYTPLILALAPIGWARDRMKYSDKHKDAPLASMLTRGYTYMPSFLADMTAIQSMNEMLNNLFTSKFTAKIANVFEPEEGIERTQMDKFKSDISSILMDVLGSFRTTLEGFYTPGVYRDMVKIWENLTQKELEMPANELKKLWARNPISVLDRRPEGIVYRDVLGRPTTRPWFLSEFLSVTDKEDIMTYHTDNAEPLGGVDMKRSTLPIYEGGKLVIRKINPGDAKDAELWDYYVERRGYYLLRGTSISEEQLLGIEALKAHGVKGEEYQKAVTKLDGYAKKAAKEDVMWMSQFDLNYIRSQRGR